MVAPEKPKSCRAMRLLVIAVPALAALALLVAAGRWWNDRALSQLTKKLNQEGPASALVAVDAYLTSRPEDSRALAVKAMALAKLERWDEACLAFSAARAESVEELLSWSMALGHCRRWSEALPLLKQILAREPDHPLALRNAATCEFQLGDTAAALASARRLARQAGHEVEGEFLCGAIHRSRGETQLAVASWGRVENLRPRGDELPISPDEFFFAYAEDLLSTGMARSAVTKLQQCAEAEQNARIQLLLGRAWATISETAQARAAWQRALALDQNNPAARLGLAELALRESDAKAAGEWLDPLKSRPDFNSSMAYLFERVYTALGNEKERLHWQQETARLHLAEREQSAFKRKLRLGVPEQPSGGPAAMEQ